MLAALSTPAPAEARLTDVGILNFGLRFERLQATFYTQAHQVGTVGRMSPARREWAETLGAQSSWTVEVDGAATPEDPSDDIFTISGVDQGVSTQVSQISASGVVIDPSCRKNPIAGTATVQKVSGFSIVNATVRFHQACDGKADVNGAAVSMEFLR